MKYAWLFVVAGCASGWKQKTPEPEEPDSRTEYTPAPEAPPIAATSTPCKHMVHSTLAGFTVASANASSFVHNICFATEIALAHVTNLTGVSGFELEVTLHEIKQSGLHVKCRLTTTVRAGATVIGVFDQVTTGQASSTKPADLEASKRACIDANIDDLVRQRAVPAMRRHKAAAPISLPSQNP